MSFYKNRDGLLVGKGPLYTIKNALATVNTEAHGDTAIGDLSGAEIEATPTPELIKTARIPKGAVIEAARIVVDEAFDGTLSVKVYDADGVEDTTNTLWAADVADTDLTAGAVVNGGGSLIGEQLVDGDRWVAVVSSDATAGTGRLVVRYAK